MGFSWSSCVAQSTLLSICSEAGLHDRHVLATDAPLPHDLSLAFAVATDDLMIFSTGEAGVTDRKAREVESVMIKRGIAKNPDKDVDDTLLVSTSLMGDIGAHLGVAYGLCSTLFLTWFLLASVRKVLWPATLAFSSGLTCLDGCSSASSTEFMVSALVLWRVTGMCDRFLVKSLVNSCLT